MISTIAIWILRLLFGAFLALSIYNHDHGVAVAFAALFIGTFIFLDSNEDY